MSDTKTVKKTQSKKRSTASTTGASKSRTSKTVGGVLPWLTNWFQTSNDKPEKPIVGTPYLTNNPAVWQYEQKLRNQSKAIKKEPKTRKAQRQMYKLMHKKKAGAKKPKNAAVRESERLGLIPHLGSMANRFAKPGTPAHDYLRKEVFRDTKLPNLQYKSWPQLEAELMANMTHKLKVE